MSSSHKNLSDFSQNSGNRDGKRLKIAIVVADWNREITDALLQGAIDTLLENGVEQINIKIARVPGTYELPQAASMFVSSSLFTPNAVICLGCVIKGETSHNEYINHSVAQSLQTLAIDYKVPCVFGVLTPNDHQQALDRAGGKHGNKGAEAAVTALEMANLYRAMQAGRF